jgi:uroporphyrinogen-III synthase
VRSFAAGVGSAGLAAARDTVVGAIGPVTQRALAEVGLSATAVAERPTPEAMVEALAEAFLRRREEEKA